MEQREDGLAGVILRRTQWQVAAKRAQASGGHLPFEVNETSYATAWPARRNTEHLMMKCIRTRSQTSQNGLGSRARVNPNTGVSIAGPDDLRDR